MGSASRASRRSSAGSSSTGGSRPARIPSASPELARRAQVLSALARRSTRSPSGLERVVVEADRAAPRHGARRPGPARRGARRPARSAPARRRAARASPAPARARRRRGLAAARATATGPLFSPHPPGTLGATRSRRRSTRRRASVRGMPGRHKVFLGMAAGVGKTYRMLQEGRAELEAGRDVVIGYLEPHGREETEAQADGLPRLARRHVTYKDVPFEEMDLPGDPRAPPGAGADRRARAHQRARARARQALRGRRRRAGCRHRRLLDGQRPAPRVAQRPGGRADRRARARDVPRLRARRRPTRSCSSTSRRRALIERLPRGQGLPARARAGRAERLLPRREPRGAARGRAAPGGRGRRGQAAQGATSSRAREDRLMDRAAPQAVGERLLALVTPQPSLAADRAPRVALRAAARRRARRADRARRASRRRPSASRSRRSAGSRSLLGAHVIVEEGDDVAEVAARVARERRLDLRADRDRRRRARGLRRLLRAAHRPAGARAAGRRRADRRRPLQARVDAAMTLTRCSSSPGSLLGAARRRCCSCAGGATRASARRRGASCSRTSARSCRSRRSTPRCGSPASRTRRSSPPTSLRCRWRCSLEAPIARACGPAFELQEAIEQRAAAAGIAVDGRIGRGRTVRHALRQTAGRRALRPHRRRRRRPRTPTASAPPTSRGCSSTRRARSSCCGRPTRPRSPLRSARARAMPRRASPGVLSVPSGTVRREVRRAHAARRSCPLSAVAAQAGQIATVGQLFPFEGDKAGAERNSPHPTVTARQPLTKS